MITDQGLIIGGDSGAAVLQLAAMSNRHGLIAGATGTGKTVTLQVLAEGYSRMGVPVFAADVKGDLSGIATEGSPHPKIDERLARLPLPGYRRRGSPVLFWDVYGESGHPIRTTVSEMGPLLFSNLLQLNDNQEGLLYAAFSIADDEGLLMLDLKDLRAMLVWMGEHAGELRSEYGNIAPQSIGAIQRRLLVLQEQGGDHLFGEPAVSLDDLMQVDFSGNGVISLLDASRLTRESPRVYTALLLWLLAELFERLPEQGDADRPRLVLFFDEAHLLFEDAPKALLDKVEQVVRLVRSKGVGVYFVTQSPMDIPEDVLGQLGLKVQHALRAFTPKDRKVVKLVAQNFRDNPDLDTEALLTELGTGEALVSALDAKGRPEPVRHTLVAPPESRIGPLTSEERAERLQRSPLRGRYEQAVDRESAYEVLAERAEALAAAAARDSDRRAPPRRGSRQGVTEAFATSAARSIGNQIGRALARGLLGSLFGARRR